MFKPTQAFIGVQIAIQALPLLWHKSIRAYVLWPVLISVLIFGGGLIGVWYFFDDLFSYLFGFPWWLKWLEWLLGWLLKVLFVIMFAIICFFTFTLIANLFAAPFNALLAAKVEETLTGMRPMEADMPVGKLVVTTMWTEVKKMGYLLKWLIPLGIITLIPGINLIAPLLWLYYGAWFMAVEYMDLPMGNHNIAYADQIDVLKSKRSLCLGFGGVINLITALPVINIIAMPLGVVGATKLWAMQFKGEDASVKLQEIVTLS